MGPSHKVGSPLPLSPALLRAHGHALPTRACTSHVHGLRCCTTRFAIAQHQVFFLHASLTPMPAEVPKYEYEKHRSNSIKIDN